MSALRDALQAAQADRESGPEEVASFRRAAIRPLLTADDGRRYAIDVLRALRAAGTERCRANGQQTDSLIWALLMVKERGSYQCLIGFAQVLTDAAGTRGPEPVPELYEGMRFPPVRLNRLRRLVERGLWSAAFAMPSGESG